MCGFWGLEERTGAFVRAFLGTWKKALHRAYYAMWRPTCVHFRGLEERRLGLNPLAQAQNAA